MMSSRRARTIVVSSCVALCACGGREARTDVATPMPNRPLEAYAEQGLITGGEEFPAVAGFATVAGPADSTWVLFGMSLPTGALRFHRDGDGFSAGYSVRIRFTRDGLEQARRDRSAQVRVATFEETGRTDESLVYQDFVLLTPGTYVVDLIVRDSIGTRGLSVTDTIAVPAYGAGDVALLLVHEATGRATLGEPPRLVPNSRRSTAFGGAPPRVYLEVYDSTGAPLDVIVRDEAGAELLSVTVEPTRADSLAPRTATVELPADSLPLGLVTVGLRDRDAPSQPMLVTISDQWMVANYDEVLDYLAYIASREEIDTLRAAAGAAERRAAWDAFWARRDPVPASAVNEYREEFFERVRVAAEQFAEVGRPGWRTDRGEVYIVLGPPDRVTRGEVDARDMVGALDAIEWYYDREGGGRVALLFLDREGFGRFEMTRSSELAFRAIADRLRTPGD